MEDSTWTKFWLSLCKSTLTSRLSLLPLPSLAAMLIPSRSPSSHGDDSITSLDPGKAPSSRQGRQGCDLESTAKY